jgi:hypothetical protein
MPRHAKTAHEHLLKVIRDYNPTATESTIKTYCSNVEKIYRDLGAEAGDFDLGLLKDTEKVFETLDSKDFTKNTYKNKLSSIITFLLASGVDKKIINKYSDKVDSLSAKIDRDKAKMEWTDKEKENIMSVQELKEYLNDFKSNLPGKIETYADIYKYQLYLCGAFQLEFPVRNELADIQIYNSGEYSNIPKNESVNYFVINPKTNKMKVILNNYKTKKVNGDIDFEVDDKELVKMFSKYYLAIKNYFKDRDFEHWLLFDSKGNKVSRNDYTRLLNKTFELSGKKISSSLIRKIVLSELYPVDKMKKLARIMGHSIKTAVTDYVRS